MPSNDRSLARILPLLFLVMITVSPLLLADSISLYFPSTTEYTRYVHHNVNSGSLGNWTLLEKPVFPVLINASQIQIGANWSIVCPLVAGHRYHVYCYGSWVDSSAATTDYDIQVFDPSGKLESSHTEAVGIIEHLGSAAGGSLFVPLQSGNYTFVVKNDLRESTGADRATFVIVENLECNKWYSHVIEGKDAGSSLSGFRTCWTFEFITNESYVELFVKVPDSLDMYEARLYLMNNAESLNVNSFPLAWEPGLYGNVSEVVGGYNFESEGYRGVAYTSCKVKGQDLFLNYSSSNPGANLYYVVLMGEEGSGEVEFLLKSSFEKVGLEPLVPLGRVYPGNTTKLSFASSFAELESARLSYTVDGWVTSTTVDMVVDGKVCNGTVPGQAAGSLVEYRVEAVDVLRNTLETTGSFSVKNAGTLDIAVVKDEIFLGENVTVTGFLSPNDASSRVTVRFISSNSTEQIDCVVFANGTFAGNFPPDSAGVWAVTATSVETQTSYQCDSQQLMVTVKEPPFHIKYQLYIIAGLVAALAVGGVVYFLKFRER